MGRGVHWGGAIRTGDSPNSPSPIIHSCLPSSPLDPRRV